MDITLVTKELINKVQPLKLKYKDLASQTFIDFYCQCRQGCDYLFPDPLKNSVTVLTILQWFFDSVERQSPSSLVELMWKDVVGPTLAEYEDDEKIEHNLEDVFHQPALAQSVSRWDREPSYDGGVTLILRELLRDIQQLEVN